MTHCIKGPLFVSPRPQKSQDLSCVEGMHAWLKLLTESNMNEEYTAGGHNYKRADHFPCKQVHGAGLNLAERVAHHHLGEGREPVGPAEQLEDDD